MSQFGVPDVSAAMPAQQKTSGLAVTALVCSLIFCCPITTILGVLLGLGALVSIGSDPMKKGRGLAVTAIVIGLLATAAQAWGGWMLWDRVYSKMFTGPGAELKAAMAGDPDGVRAGMYGAAATASDEEILAFAAELRARYGELQTVTFAPNQGQPQFGDTEVPFNYLLEFDQATVDAEATILFADETTGEFVARWTQITVKDDELGDLVFPPEEAGMPEASDADVDAEADAEGDVDAGGEG